MEKRFFFSCLLDLISSLSVNFPSFFWRGEKRKEGGLLKRERERKSGISRGKREETPLEREKERRREEWEYKTRGTGYDALRSALQMTLPVGLSLSTDGTGTVGEPEGW